ncbi:hypothetical protein C8J56DRAFT_945554, partial [Mycena floridula]
MRLSTTFAALSILVALAMGTAIPMSKVNLSVGKPGAIRPWNEGLLNQLRNNRPGQHTRDHARLHLDDRARGERKQAHHLVHQEQTHSGLHQEDNMRPKPSRNLGGVQKKIAARDFEDTI